MFPQFFFYMTSCQLVISVTQSCSNYKLSLICFYVGNQIYPVNFLYLMFTKKTAPEGRPLKKSLYILSIGTDATP